MTQKYNSIYRKLRRWAEQPGRDIGERVLLLEHTYKTSVSYVEGRAIVCKDDFGVIKAKIHHNVDSLPNLILDNGASNSWWKRLSLKENLAFNEKKVRVFFINTRLVGFEGSNAAVAFMEKIKNA